MADIEGTSSITLDSFSASGEGTAEVQFLTASLDLNLTIPHAVEDPDEQQKILIENFTKLQQLLRNLGQ